MKVSVVGIVVAACLAASATALPALPVNLMALASNPTESLSQVPGLSLVSKLAGTGPNGQLVRNLLVKAKLAQVSESKPEALKPTAKPKQAPVAAAAQVGTDASQMTPEMMNQLAAEWDALQQAAAAQGSNNNNNVALQRRLLDTNQLLSTVNSLVNPDEVPNSSAQLTANTPKTPVAQTFAQEPVSPMAAAGAAEDLMAYPAGRQGLVRRQNPLTMVIGLVGSLVPGGGQGEDASPPAPKGAAPASPAPDADQVAENQVDGEQGPQNLLPGNDSVQDEGDDSGEGDIDNLQDGQTEIESTNATPGLLKRAFPLSLLAPVTSLLNPSSQASTPVEAPKGEAPSPMAGPQNFADTLPVFKMLKKLPGNPLQQDFDSASKDAVANKAEITKPKGHGDQGEKSTGHDHHRGYRQGGHHDAGYGYGRGRPSYGPYKRPSYGSRHGHSGHHNSHVYNNDFQPYATEAEAGQI
ncbi:hypothetical protein H4R34_002190 [Dimargaris verticillata]|uniref:Uncharacterized protein n=1 Tax=Dimargaris verticillata TaxID=2761393 RepID=A0A9W8B295_9FUNG|nr:hypothetical protein H4R34_002190 [Dimargaris verticillata]